MRVTLLPLLLLAACAAAPTLSPDQIADRLWQAHRDRLNLARTEYAARVAFPRVLRGPDGTLVVTRAVLEGLPGEEYVRVRFTYVNETNRTFDYVYVGFHVNDGYARQRNQETFELVMPMQYRFTPGSSYTDERIVPTMGAHDVPGWDFVMDARGVAR